MFEYDDIDHEVGRHFDYLGLLELANRFVFIREERIIYSEAIVERGLELMRHCIRDLKKIPVLCTSANAVYIDRYILELNQHFDPDQYFVFNADCRVEKSSAFNVAPWPFALLLQQMGVKDYSRNFVKQYRISSLSRIPRLHRLKLLVDLRPYVTDCDVVVGNVFEQTIPSEVKNSSLYMSWVNQLPWANRSEFIDLDQNLNLITYTDISHPGYQACVNITNESCSQDDLLFVTEKTWKAYACKCLVVNYGSRDMPSELEKMGLQIWKEYDENLSYPDKIGRIIELFQRCDIEDIYHSSHSMVEHNYHMVTSKEFALKLARPAIEKLLNFKPA